MLSDETLEHHVRGKLTIFLKKRNNTIIDYSVLHQTEDLRYGNANNFTFMHGNVSIYTLDKPGIFEAKGLISVYIRGSNRIMDKAVGMLEFSDIEDRDSAYDQILGAFKAFADNNYFSTKPKAEKSDDVHTF
jgi:hypothetical protein